MESWTSTRPRKLPKQERSRITVEAILEAAARVLVSEGYARASTKRVALVAGVSIGSLYQYFPNKDSLVVALYERHLEELLAIYARKLKEVSEKPLREAVRELIRTSIELHAVDPDLHSVLVEQVPRSTRGGREGTLERRIMDGTRAFLASRRMEIRPRNLDLAAFVVTEAVESLTHAAVLEYPGYLDEELVEEVATLVLGYLSPPRENIPQ